MEKRHKKELGDSTTPGFNIPFASDCNDTDSGRPQVTGSGYRLPSNTVETARQHRFRFSVTFAPAAGLQPGTQNRAGGIFDFWPQKISRPVTEIDEIVVHNAQDEIWRPGKQHHQPIEIDFYETTLDVTVGGAFGFNASARALFEWWRNQTLNYQDSLIRGPTFLDNTVNIAQLSGTGSDIWNYFLYRCWPQKVTPQSLDYTESAICQTTVRLRYDKIDERLTEQTP